LINTLELNTVIKIAFFNSHFLFLFNYLNIVPSNELFVLPEF